MVWEDQDRGPEAIQVAVVVDLVVGIGLDLVTPHIGVIAPHRHQLGGA